MPRLKRPVRRGKRTWVVLHCEVALTSETWLVDEDVFYTASSLRSVEKLIRSSWIEPGTWWRVESARLDDVEGTRAEDRMGTIFYSRSGKVIPSAPRMQGYRAAIERDRRAAKMVQDSLASAMHEGRPKKQIKNLQSALQGIREVLSHHK